MPQYAAVLDACVLVPIALGDTLLRVAEKGLYRPLWSDRIPGRSSDHRPYEGSQLHGVTCRKRVRRV